ncbi:MULTISPECIES: hypothetical protein [Vibrio]|uniref:hypothetical protein n=1 Tax=Vibrio TaxID=662 RepID=UPI00063167EB|nr:hypothetical protein [Vibrio coralliirubri]CDT05017.1 conserved hypothetical protein [Vibrio coralliirubri]CDT57663.1 conserved hypothetical protein [Vibrio coralliirubri]CDT67796.1 conserved hypothetical protein [Vibrio coralliirubri]CDT85254.1 conserved hypothetical protein [Vibrio coralliirubri]CDU12822.1 conserved hypothetical protein [Vibrio coralliirubri]
MLAKNLIVSAMEDIDTFFYDEVEFTVKYELDCNDLGIAAVRSVGDQARIYFSKDLCNFEVDSVERFLFVLFIVSHELAHFVSFHHMHNDQEKLDSVSIESRADFFGAQIALTLMTFGKSIHGLLQKYNLNNENKGIEPKTIINAIFSLNEQVFVNNTSLRYPTSQYRVMSMLAACIAFFSVYSTEHEQKFDIWFVRELSKSKNLAKLPLIDEYEDTISIISSRLDDIHKKLQWENPVSIGGIKFEYAPYLTINYILPDEFISKQKKYGKERFSQLFNEAIGVNFEK